MKKNDPDGPTVDNALSAPSEPRAASLPPLADGLPVNDPHLSALEGAYVFEGVPIVRTNCHIPPHALCDRCKTGVENGDLFRPCRCNNGERYFHRTCFRTWRMGWINPRNYFACPDCMTAYHIERVKQSNIASDTHQRIVRHFRIRIATFYLMMVLLLAALIGGIAGIAYGADTTDKNVPVGVKYMLTSVVSGLPPANATSIWREQFKQPGTPVWPYYTLLGAFCAALVILTVFAIVGCTFDESERRRRSCSDQCGCSSGNPVWTCNTCYCPCDTCCNSNVAQNVRGGSGRGGSNSCSGGCGDCNGDGAEVLIVIVLVLIVLVLLSAIVVVILYAIKKWVLFHDRMTDMISNQASELESETIVLGIDETLRPLDAV